MLFVCLIESNGAGRIIGGIKICNFFGVVKFQRMRMYGLLLFFQFVKSLQNIWNICFITLLLHPQSREIAFAEVLKNNFLKKTFKNIWK